MGDCTFCRPSVLIMKYFKIFENFAEVIEPLDDAELGRLLRGMMQYSSLGEIPEFHGNERYLWGAAKSLIDNQRQSYDNKVNGAAKAREKRSDINNNHNDINNNQTDINMISTQEKKRKEKIREDKIDIYKRFTPPSVDEVKEYCSERNNTIDAQTFVDFYASKGWMVGKNKMKDWKAAVRTWEQSRPRKTNAALNYKQTPISEKDFNALVVNLDD